MVRRGAEGERRTLPPHLLALTEAVQSVAKVAPVVGHDEIVGQGSGMFGLRSNGYHRPLDEAFDLRTGDENPGDRCDATHRPPFSPFDPVQQRSQRPSS